VDGAPRALKAAVKSFAARHVTGNQPIFNAYFEGFSGYMTNHISKSTPSGAQNGSKPDHPRLDETSSALTYVIDAIRGKLRIKLTVRGDALGQRRTKTVCLRVYERLLKEHDEQEEQKGD